MNGLVHEQYEENEKLRYRSFRHKRTEGNREEPQGNGACKRGLYT